MEDNCNRSLRSLAECVWHERLVEQRQLLQNVMQFLQNI